MPHYFNKVCQCELSTLSASRIHLSSEAREALLAYPAYKTEVRGETFVKVCAVTVIVTFSPQFLLHVAYADIHDHAFKLYDLWYFVKV